MLNRDIQWKTRKKTNKTPQEYTVIASRHGLMARSGGFGAAKSAARPLHGFVPTNR